MGPNGSGARMSSLLLVICFQVLRETDGKDKDTGSNKCRYVGSREHCMKSFGRMGQLPSLLSQDARVSGKNLFV